MQQGWYSNSITSWFNGRVQFHSIFSINNKHFYIIFTEDDLLRQTERTKHTNRRISRIGRLCQNDPGQGRLGVSLGSDGLMASFRKTALQCRNRILPSRSTTNDFKPSSSNQSLIVQAVSDVTPTADQSDYVFYALMTSSSDREVVDKSQPVSVICAFSLTSVDDALNSASLHPPSRQSIHPRSNNSSSSSSKMTFTNGRTVGNENVQPEEKSAEQWRATRPLEEAIENIAYRSHSCTPYQWSPFLTQFATNHPLVVDSVPAVGPLTTVTDPSPSDQDDEQDSNSKYSLIYNLWKTTHVKSNALSLASFHLPNILDGVGEEEERNLVPQQIINMLVDWTDRRQGDNQTYNTLYLSTDSGAIVEIELAIDLRRNINYRVIINSPNEGPKPTHLKGPRGNQSLIVGIRSFQLFPDHREIVSLQHLPVSNSVADEMSSEPTLKLARQFLVVTRNSITFFSPKNRLQAQLIHPMNDDSYNQVAASSSPASLTTVKGTSSSPGTTSRTSHVFTSALLVTATIILLVTLPIGLLVGYCVGRRVVTPPPTEQRCKQNGVELLSREKQLVSYQHQWFPVRNTKGDQNDQFVVIMNNQLEFVERTLVDDDQIV